MSDGEPKVPESEKILAQIEAAQQAAKSEVKSVSEEGTQSAQSAVETPSQSTEQKTAPAESGQAVSQDIKEQAPAVKADKPVDDVREWAKKKGIKDADAALRSLRELERELHRRSFEAKSSGNVPRGETPQVQPQWQPQPQMPAWNPQPVPPQYPAYPIDREKIIEQEAKRYNMAPEDFERVLSLSNDIVAMQTRRLKAEFDAQLQEINRETRRNSELRELMQDPLFTNEKVQFEMHNVLKENPQAFTLEPSPYLYAFNEAQRRLARQYLQDGSNESERSDVKSSLPSRPPSEGSRGSNPSFEKSKEETILENFDKAKTAEEKRKILTSLGAVQSY